MPHLPPYFPRCFSDSHLMPCLRQLSCDISFVSITTPSFTCRRETRLQAQLRTSGPSRSGNSGLPVLARGSNKNGAAHRFSLCCSVPPVPTFALCRRALQCLFVLVLPAVGHLPAYSTRVIPGNMLIQFVPKWMKFSGQFIPAAAI